MFNQRLCRTPFDCKKIQNLTFSVRFVYRVLIEDLVNNRHIVKGKFGGRPGPLDSPPPPLVPPVTYRGIILYILF